MNQENARFDARLPKEQKQMFERAATLGGYRSLTDFVLEAAQSKAQEIIENRERILSTARDQEIFFDALMAPAEPNKDLLSAKESYLKRISE